MNRQGLLGLTVMLAGVCSLAAWRIATGIMADRLATGDPERALRLRADHPIARLTLARRKLPNELAHAAVTLRQLLAAEPLQGKAFAFIAAAAADSDQARALHLHRIAVRRAPRDTRARVWLINHFLKTGRYGKALEQIDTLLRIAPAYREQLFPAMTQLANEPVFSDALARALLGRPAWRAGFLEVLQIQGEPATTSRLLGELVRQGGLAPEEFDRWIALLIQQMRWNEAYSRWAGNLALDGSEPLRAVHNGDFGSPPSSTGFDWRLLKASGVELDFIHEGTRGRVAKANFPGRPVAKVNLEQPLLLAPGRYRFSARMRANSLDGEYGLEWTVVCADRPQSLGNSERVEGSFAWREIHFDFNVPATDCPAQWLKLLNPAPAGATQTMAGEVRFDDVSIQPLGNEVRAAVATLQADPGAAMRSQGADFVPVKSAARMAHGQRVMLTRDGRGLITYDNGCKQRYNEAGVYRIEQAACRFESKRDIKLAPEQVPGSVVAGRAVVVPTIVALTKDGVAQTLPIGR